MIKILFVLIGISASWGISHSQTIGNISNNQNEVKNPLDTVLMGYDKRVRPYFGSGRPVTVGVSAYVLSISSISEVDMVNWSFYSTYLEFNETWWSFSIHKLLQLHQFSLNSN